MASLINIFNRAQQEVGGQRILTIDENSPGKRACDNAWDMVRQEVLSDHVWNCCVQRAQLGADSEAPAHGYEQRYLLPPNTFRIVTVNEFDSQHNRWVVEAGFILANITAPIDVVFTQDKERNDTTLFPGLLVSALALRLAMAIAERRTQSNSKGVTIETRYLRVLSRAKQADTVEQSSVIPWLSESAAVRVSGFDSIPANRFSAP